MYRSRYHGYIWRARRHFCATCKVLVSFFFNLFFPSALNISLRLNGGPGPYAGRIEVKYNGTWGSVCDDGLDITVGHVICRQLGYPGAVAVPCCGAFGVGSGPFWLAGVKCQGNESSLIECRRRDWGDNICNHRRLLDDASVVCRSPNISVCKLLLVAFVDHRNVFNSLSWGFCYLIFDVTCCVFYPMFANFEVSWLEERLQFTDFNLLL